VDIAVTLLGMIYIGWFFSYFLFIRALTEKGAYLLFLMATIWALDIIAYAAGTKFGRHKLFPSVSPQKSVEGAVAGFVFCLAAAGIFGYYAGFDMTHSIILGAIIGVVAQLSDLVESLIKRDAGVKDSSSLMPGHGGVLDRMDSFILTAPVFYYYLVWVMLK
jgi:phosphatidate cytidylyltransferase